MAQPGFGPPSLSVGTEVSAKYRGAFCEAKVKAVVRVVKCKVVMKDGQSTILVTDEDVKGSIKVGAVVEVKHPTTSQPVEATITKLIDHSTYTVVFNDDDERTLRRTQLCLKGEKHFIESETLDNLPLSHPEHFGTPVLQNKKAKRKNGDESDDGEDRSEEESPRRATYRGHHQELVGKLMLVDLPNRKGLAIPALVVLPDASSTCEVKNRDQILVRSFKDSKFMTVARKNLKDFLRAVAVKNDDKTLKSAFEKALLYHDTKELPVGWDKTDMLGSDFDSGDIDDEYASEDEPFEEKDRFVAQLYKFMDERGTPINKGPCIGNKDLNLYKLYKIVKNLGGYNKVTKEMKWPIVYNKMGLTSVHLSPAHQIKAAYKKYLDAFETFYRKLGSTMGTMSRPGRSRQTGGRSLLSFRAREKITKPAEKVTQNKETAENTKQKPQVSSDKLEDIQVSTSVPTSNDGDVVMRRTPRRDAGSQGIKEESKDKKDETDKSKKEDSPKAKKEEKKDDSSIHKSKKDDTFLVKSKKEDKKDDCPVQKSKKEEKKDDTPVQKSKKDDNPVQKSKKEEKKDDTPVQKSKKEEKKDDNPIQKSKKEEKKDDSPVQKSKKEEKKDDNPVQKSKKEDSRIPKLKKEDGLSPKAKKDELVKGKKEEEMKDERKSVRKIKVEEEKVGKGSKKEKEEEKKVETKQEAAVPKDSPKKRMTRSKLTPVDVKKDIEVKRDIEVKEDIDEKKEPVKKLVNKDAEVVEKKEKDIPRTLERRDSRASDKKESTAKLIEKKDKSVEKKVKPPEEIKPKKEKKGKEEEEEEALDESKSPSVSAHSEEGEDLEVEMADFPIGSMLKVKYGRGKNQKIYIAKVVDHGRDGVHRTYLVHYAGWNTRYDEWIRADRVITVLNRPEDENSRTPPSRSQSVPSCIKDSNSPSSTKVSADMDKPGQIFRTPKQKHFDSKTRTTRSSSSDTCVTKSHLSSGLDDASDSDQGDDEEEDDADYDNTKDENAQDDDLMNTEEYEQMDESMKVQAADADFIMEEFDAKEVPPQPVVSTEIFTEDVDDSEKKTRKTYAKDANLFEQIIGNVSIETEDTVKTVIKKEVKDALKKDSLKELPGKYDSNLLTKFQSSSERERKSVSVVVENGALYEIKSSVSLDKEDHDGENEADVKKSKIIPEIIMDFEESKSSKLEIVEETNSDENENNSEEKHISKSDQTDRMPDDVVPPYLTDKTVSQVKKVDLEREKMENLPEKVKTGRGKKYNTPKDVKKSPRVPDTLSTSLNTVVQASELMSQSSVSTAGKLEPSPYDFDAEVDTPWHPEITKKWEPNQKAPIVIKEGKESLATSEGDEKEKKVKKKVKIKSSDLEAQGEELILSVESSVHEIVSERILTSPTMAEMSTEGKGSKKKGRKKKEMSLETKKEVSDLYESTVNSVVEAVKHSLQETESDQEQRPAVKKRRVKRLSESDRKDVTTRVTRVGRKVANRESLDSSISVGELRSNSEKSIPQSIPPDNETVGSNSAQTNEISSSSTSVSELEKSIENIKKELSFCESQGFEPQLQSLDSGAHYDNTPPTTPEHDEEEHRNTAMQHAENLCHLSNVLPKINPPKDNVKAFGVASSTISSSLPASSSKFALSKTVIELPSDNEVLSTASTDNLDNVLTMQQSEGSGTDQDVPTSKKRMAVEDTPSNVSEVKKRRVHGTRSRTAKKSPKYTGNSDSQGSSSNTPNHCPESPPTKLTDMSKSPRPSKYTFNADLGEYLEGEARCNFLINKMRDIKSIYMSLKAEVASIDRRRKRAKKKEKESLQTSSIDKEVPT